MDQLKQLLPRGSRASAPLRRRRPAVLAEREEREVDGVQMITKVEDAREARAGPLLLRPGTVLGLPVKEELDPAADGVAVAFTGSDQPQHRPRRLRGGARSH